MHDGGAQRDRLEFRPIGTGDIDHRRVVELLSRSGYQGYLSGEWIGWDAPDMYLPRELAAMKQYERKLARS
jgi:sugar phosphate isomerase/epimerase